MRIILTLLFFGVAGCQGEHKNQELSPLAGKWITDACDQFEPAAKWGKGIFDFNSFGQIIMGFRSFDDSSCSGEFVSVEQPQVSVEIQLTFNDIGEEILDEGIEGGRVEITIPAPEPIIIQGFYTINGSSLCFSDNLNFGVLSWSTSEAEFTSIDFEKCLSKLI